jgi:hypothetical protein
VKRKKSTDRLKSELRNTLRPEVNLPTLANDICQFLDKHAGKSARNPNVANNLAAYLTQKYSVSDRKTGELRSLIERYPEELAAFLDRITFKKIQLFLKTVDQLPPTKKKPRVKAKTEAEAGQRRKKSKKRYEQRRREFREGLIIEQFGKSPRSQALDLDSRRLPEGQGCLDIFFRGDAIRMGGHWDSLENLFGVDRHRFSDSLPRKRRGRNVVYYLDAFIEGLIHLLANRDGNQQWPPEPTQRELVLRGIIKRAYRFSPKIGDMLAEKLRPYLT